MRLLVVTPTLGGSRYLMDLCEQMRHVLPCSADHLIVTPPSSVTSVRGIAPSAKVVSERGRRGVFGCINDAIAEYGDGYSHFTYINDDDQLLDGFWLSWRDVLQGIIEADVTYGRVNFVFSDSSDIMEVPQIRRSVLLRAGVRSGLIPLTQQGVLIRIETFRSLNGFDERYRLCADTDFWIRAILSERVRFEWKNRFHANYRLRVGQMSSDHRLQAEEMSAITARVGPCSLGERLVARACFYGDNLSAYASRLTKFGFRSVRGVMNQVGRDKS